MVVSIFLCDYWSKITFLLFIFKSSLNILDVDPLSVIGLTSIFSHSVDSLYFSEVTELILPEDEHGF